MDKVRKLEVLSSMYGKSEKLANLIKGYHDDIKRGDIDTADEEIERMIGEIITDLDIETQELWFECDDED